MDTSVSQSLENTNALGTQTNANPTDISAQLALLQQQQQYMQQMMQLPNNEHLRAMLNSNSMMVPPYMLTAQAMFPRTAGTNATAGTGVDGSQEEEPVYVNAKQYHRIMIRRQQRAKLEAKLGNTRQRKAYMHDSRHKHAMRRPRGPGGRFLTKDEIEGLKNGSLTFEDLPGKAEKR